jgi:acetylserotonin N-methyltransferase
MSYLPDPSPITDLLDAFRRSKVLFVAVSLGIFDRLAKSPERLEVLAGELRANTDSLERLLDACRGLGLLELADGAYANTEVSRAYLLSASPHTLTGYIRYSEFALYSLWGNLKDAVLEGSNRWGQTFGAAPGSLFDNFFKSDQAKRDFLAGMNGFGMLSSPSVVAAFDLSKFRHMVDLGGATGHLVIAACERYPELRATVFDLPSVVPVAREYMQRSSAAARLDAVAGDFFTDALPAADLYSLGRILHDWSPEKIRILLDKIYATLPSGGALLIAERLLNDDKSGPPAAQLQSLNMLVCTEGKERTFPEYRAILEESGFTAVEHNRTGKAVDAIIARKS